MARGGADKSIFEWLAGFDSTMRARMGFPFGQK
jgi:hypothetical protein